MSRIPHVTRSVLIELNNGETRVAHGIVDRDLDDAILKLKGRPAPAARVGKIVDALLDNRQRISWGQPLVAFAVAAAEAAGSGAVARAEYRGRLGNREVSVPLSVRPSDAAAAQETLRAKLEPLWQSPGVEMTERLLQQEVPSQRALDDAFTQEADYKLSVDLHNDFYVKKGVMGTTQFRQFARRLKTCPAIGPASFDIVLNMLKGPKIADPEDWWLVGAALQEHHATGSFSRVATDERIALELHELAFELHRNESRLTHEHAIRLLVLGTIQGVPTPRIRNILANITERYADRMTTKAHRLLRRYLLTSPAMPHKEWTLLLYLPCDCDLSVAAMDDINELERAYASVAPFINIVILLDASSDVMGDQGVFGWRAGTRLLVVEPARHWNSKQLSSREIEVPVDTPLGRRMQKKRDLNSASGRVLGEVLQYVSQAFPSDKLFVGFGTHGDGSRGLGWDYDHKGDAIRMRELVRAIKETGRPIDVVGFDACMMQNLGVLGNLMAADVKYVVGSEEIEPGSGWRYDALLRALAGVHREHGALSAEDFARTAVQVYDGPTMSAADLGQAQRILERVDHFAAAFNEIPDREHHLPRVASRLNRYHQGKSGHVDATQLARVAASEVPSEKVQAASAAIEEAIAQSLLEKRTSADYEEFSHGLSVHLPFDGKRNRRRHNPWLRNTPQWRAFIKWAEAHPAMQAKPKKRKRNGG